MSPEFTKKINGFNLSIYSLKNMELFEIINNNGSSLVYKAELMKESVAIKIFLEADETELLKLLSYEISVYKRIKNKKLHLYGIFINNNDIGLVLKYVDGPRLDIYLQKPLKRIEKIMLTLNIANEIKYLHDMNIIHRDIKPSNIICHNGSITFIDYGISKTSNETITENEKGTVIYAPPEAFCVCDEKKIFKINKYYDIWSLGCVIYEIFSNEKPWGDAYEDQILINLCNWESFKYSKNFMQKNLHLQKILKKCVNPTERCDIDFVIKFFSKIMKKYVILYNYCDYVFLKAPKYISHVEKKYMLEYTFFRK